MDTELVEPQASEPNLDDSSPSVTFERITFSDGTTISLAPNDVVVLVGPNNAGKSVALRELEDHIGGTLDATVVKTAKPHVSGGTEEFGAFLEEHTQIRTVESRWLYSGYRFSLRTRHDARGDWPAQLKQFRPLFCMRLATESRITDSNPADAIDFLEQPASDPIHMLYLDDQLEERMSQYFRSAFGQDLIVFRLGGNKIPLFVGHRPIPDYQEGEDRLSKTYVERVRSSAVPLFQQGDGMRSFASVILHMLAPITPSILLLDEPEAFLHPPQARLLGQMIASKKPSRSQLFLATHSPDVLQGLINVAPNHLRVLRMQREGNVNRIKELDKELVKEISVDPLMKYSSVMSGVFHERVIICESDADCMFYSSVLDLTEIHGERQADVLFVHANGKHRMATLARALVALDVPVDIVADMDLLNDQNVLREIVEALAGDWPVVQPLAEAVKTAIEEHKPWLSVDEIKNGISEELSKESLNGESAKQLRSRIGAIFRKASPWDAVKQAGEAALPAGQATQQFQELQGLCKGIGLWVVPVGEIEGFCKFVGGHGPGWVQQVIEERNLATDPELERARAFVREIWLSRRVSSP